MTEPRLTVLVPTHNPREDYLSLAISALRAQSLPASQWQLIVVDNRSDTPVQERVDLGWHPAAQVVREDTLGLTHARVAGFRCARGRLVVLVDDDNVLAPDYLERALSVSACMPLVGAWGGGIRPQFESPEAAPPKSLWHLLTLREVTADRWSNDPDHHGSTPWGAGLCVRRAVAEHYLAELAANPMRYGLDLRGSALLYGGDTDIAYTACRMGLGKAVLRELSLTHLIASARCTEEHLCRVAYGRGYSEVLHYLSAAGALPPRETGPLQWGRALRRRWHLEPLERAVDRAHARGRAEALRDFSRRM